jgi:hypothetical protein
VMGAQALASNRMQTASAPIQGLLRKLFS